MSFRGSIFELRQRLKPYPGHYRQLMASFTRHAAVLVAMRIRAWLTRRKLIIIALPERMGDIVACTPLAAKLRGEHPRSVIIWVAYAPYHQVLQGNPHIDLVIAPCCFTEWVWITKFRPIFDVFRDLLIPPCVCEKCKHGMIKEGPGSEVNRRNYYDYGTLLSAHTRSAGDMMVDGQPVAPKSRRAAEAVNRLGLPPRFVCIHSASEDGIRDWVPGHWNRLIDHIQLEHGITVVEVGTRSPLDRADGPLYRNLCGKTSIGETAEIIRLATCFIGIDSGPSHLANAAKIPSVVLMGSYHWWKWYMPYTGFYTDPNGCRIVRNDGPVSDLTPAPCLKAVDELLGGLPVLKQESQHA